MSFNGRLALATGGASSIGEAVCHILAAEGASVVVADKNFGAAQKVGESLPGKAKHCATQVDVGDSSSVDELFRNIRTTFPQLLSVVVNCAGIFGEALIHECTDELFDDVIRVNLKGTFTVTRAASREMLRSGKKLPEEGAAIVDVASITAKGCVPNIAAYAASKAGAVALSKSAAKELAGHGIRCHCVLPGWVDTPMTADASEDRKAQAMSMRPIKKTAKPEEIVSAIKFLCAPKAGSCITGVALEVTGGAHM